MKELNNFKPSKYVQFSVMCSSDVEQYDTKFIYISPVHPVTLISGTHYKRQQAAY